jgi:hypothetical protein
LSRRNLAQEIAPGKGVARTSRARRPAAASTIALAVKLCSSEGMPTWLESIDKVRRVLRLHLPFSRRAMTTPPDQAETRQAG